MRGPSASRAGALISDSQPQDCEQSIVAYTPPSLGHYSGLDEIRTHGCHPKFLPPENSNMADRAGVLGALRGKGWPHHPSETPSNWDLAQGPATRPLPRARLGPRRGGWGPHRSPTLATCLPTAGGPVLRGPKAAHLSSAPHRPPPESTSRTRVLFHAVPAPPFPPLCAPGREASPEVGTV